MSLDIIKELEAVGAVLLDKHFIYKSGKHGPGYINMDPLFPDMALMSRLCTELSYGYKFQKVDTVVGAATGGIPLAVLTAKTMIGLPAAVWADKRGDSFVFERAGFTEHLTGKTVVIVEDLLNTGDTTKKIIALVREHGGNILGVSVICNRGRETAQSLDVPELHQLSAVDFIVYDANGCPLCEQEVPIVEDIGHGAEYKEQHPGYSGSFIKLLD